MFWNDAELKALQASAVLEKIGKQQTEESWRETIIPVMLSHPELFPVAGQGNSEKASTLTQLAHMAGSLIMGYAFDIDRDEERGERQDDSDDGFELDDEDEPFKGMVPFADMVNADADRNNVCSLFILVE
jgi:N-lysine methyltransferase SETD6